MAARLFVGLCCVAGVAVLLLAAGYEYESSPIGDQIAFASDESGEGDVVVDARPALLDPMLASHVLMPADERQAPEFVGQLAQVEVNWNPKEPDRARPFVEDTPAVPAIAEVTYDGKPFGHWNSLLLNELKPEKRLEAVQAVHRFGMNGRAAESAAAMLTVLDGYSTRIWIELAVGNLDVAIEMAMEGQNSDFNADGVLIAHAVFALFEMAPSVVDQLEEHSRKEWTGIGPVVAIRLLSETAPERAIPILFDLIRDDRHGLKSDVASDRLKSLRHIPAAVDGVLALAAEQPRWRHSALSMLEDVAFTPDSVRLMLDSIQHSEHRQSLATALCTSGLLEALVKGDDLKTAGVSAEDFLRPELLPILQTIFGSRDLKLRYRQPAIELLIRTEPEPVEALNQLIKQRQQGDPVRTAAEEALERIEADPGD